MWRKVPPSQGATVLHKTVRQRGLALAVPTGRIVRSSEGPHMPVDRPELLNHPRMGLLRAFLASFLSMGSLVLVALYLGVYYERQNDRRILLANEQQNVTLRHELGSRALNGVFPDLRFLAHQNELMDLLEADTPANRARVCQEYLELSRHKGIYDQVRYIDEQGMELCRVDFRDGDPVSVPREGLQSKAQAYYFEDTIALAREEVFVSAFDLNVERGQIELPEKPMIRFCTPVFDRSGAKRGVLVLNYLGRTIRRSMQEMACPNIASVVLLNQDGYFLLGRDRSEEWGFMYPDRREKRFQAEFPAAWERMEQAETGQFTTASGVFTFAVIRPLPEGVVSTTGYRLADDNAQRQRMAAGGWRLVLVSLIPTEILRVHASGLVRNAAAIAAILLLITGAASYAVSRTVMRRKISQLMIAHMANHDALTNLPNRHLFMDRLTQTRHMAMRYGRRFALLFLDLDGFKTVNDTLGHESGDEVLRQVADRLRAAVRTSDTVARLGGDEFTVIVQELGNLSAAEVVASKAIDALGEPFLLGEGEARIGVSIGIAVFTAAGQETPDDMVRMADSAMYVAKRVGKNTFRFFAPNEAVPE